MAICVIAVVGIAPCQCFSLGGNQTTSPGRISSTGPPSRCAHPRPEVTINVWPSGCVCQAVRAHGSNVTLAQRTLAGSRGSNNVCIHTLSVHHFADPSYSSQLSRECRSADEAVVVEDAAACVLTRFIPIFS